MVEPGRALALADFAPPTLSAGERLIRFAYKLGVPGSALTSPMGKAAKARILATVLNPLPGNRMAGTALRAGHFLVHGAKMPIAQADFGGAARMTPPFERLVHSFAWLADLEASGDLRATQASLAKYHNTRAARRIAATARDLLGGNGILLENGVMQHMADIEAIHTYEGTESVQALLLGRDITGMSAFA